MTISMQPSLRALLRLDAVTCALMAVLLTFAAGSLGGLLQIPVPLLFYAGLALFPVAAFLALIARPALIPPAGAWLAVAGNMLWVAASLALAVAGWIAPNALGLAFILAQAVAVAALTLLETRALRAAR